jgi:hypothetical protein
MESFYRQRLRQPSKWTQQAKAANYDTVSLIAEQISLKKQVFDTGNTVLLHLQKEQHQS